MINAPDKLNVSTPLYEGYRAEVSWSPVDGATEYELQRSSEDDFVTIYQGERATYTDTLPDGYENVQFRVRAYHRVVETWGDTLASGITWGEDLERGGTWGDDLIGEYETSQWTTSEVFEIIPNRPPEISGEDGFLGRLQTPYSLAFSVSDPDPSNAIDIKLEIDGNEEFAVPDAVQDQEYAYDVDPFKYEYDSAHEIVITATDNKGASSWRVYTFVAVPNRAPVISGEDADLGVQYNTFEITFSVDDPDEGAAVDVVAYVNNSVLQQWDDIELGQEYSFSVNVHNYPAGQRQEIRIVATDDNGHSTTRTYSYITPTEAIYEATYYVYVDDLPKYKVTGEFELEDYLHVGCHTYFVRGVLDEVIVDSNYVTICTEIKLGTIAQIETPEDYATLRLRRNEPPQITGTYSKEYEESRPVNARLPVYADTNQRDQTMTAAFSTTTSAEYESIRDVLHADSPVLYRDRYGNRVIGIVESIPFDYISNNSADARFSMVTDFNIMITACQYDEEVPYD